MLYSPSILDLFLLGVIVIFRNSEDRSKLMPSFKQVLVRIFGFFVQLLEQLLKLVKVVAAQLDFVVVVQRDRKIELKNVVALHLDRLFVRAAGVFVVIQAAQRDRKVHVGAREIWLQVYRCAKVVECRCVSLLF